MPDSPETSAPTPAPAAAAESAAPGTSPAPATGSPQSAADEVLAQLQAEQSAAAAAASKPSSAAAAASPQSVADEVLAQLQAEQSATTQAAQAVQAATKAVDEIAATAESAQVKDPTQPAQPLGGVAEGEAVVPLQTERVPPAPELKRLLAIEVPVIVQLGTRRMSVAEVMRFSVGAIIEFQKSADEDLDLLANNKPVGKGQAVKVGENFGIKLTTVGPVKETIRKLGGL